MAFDRSTIDSGSRRAAQINEVVAELVARRSSGEAVADEIVVRAHPELAPDLADRLRTLRLIDQAHLDAISPVTIRRDPSDEHRRGSSEVDIKVAPPADSIPGYEIVREIHRGGQGVVYQAIQKATKRKVAIKVMHEGPFAGPRDRARFEREVQILGALNHPNIVGIHDSGVTSSSGFYYVMDYISGVPLDSYMSQAQRTINDTLRLFAKICDAVSAAHLRGVIHRDLKPGNIRIDTAGEPHVLDFGLAKMAVAEVTDASRPQLMSVTGQFIGSLPWASPEQAQGIPERIDVRTDVYSLGVILYQMLTGKFPYDVIGNMRDVLDNILKVEPARPSTIRKQINDEVETIVLKCLSKERERRYQSAGELARDILHYLAGEPIEAKRDSALYILRKRMARHRREFAAGGIVLLALIGAGIALLSYTRAMASARLAAELRNQADHLTRLADSHIQAGENELAKDLLNESIAKVPTVNALLKRGIVRARDALRKPWADKSKYVLGALEDFNAAWKEDGGAPFLKDGEVVVSATRPDQGSVEVLSQAIDILVLAKRDKESAKLVTALSGHASGDISNSPQGVVPIYDPAQDPLIPKTILEEPAEKARELADRNGEIHRVLPVKIDTLDPYKPSGYCKFISEMLYDTLFVVDENLNYVQNPAMVERVQPDADKKTWTIELKKGLKWHDGVPLTAEDVEHTWKYFQAVNDDYLKNVKALSDRRVRVTVRVAGSAPNVALTFAIFPKHRQPLGGPSDEAFKDERMNTPCGNGPYKIEGRRTAREVVLTRFEDYPADYKPLIAKITFQGVPFSEREQRLQKLERDEADEMELNGTEFRWSVTGDSFAGHVIKRQSDRIAYDFIRWNTKCPLFDDARVRQALARAINVEGIRQRAYGGLYPSFPGIFGRRDFSAGHNLNRFEYDAATTTRLLDEAGWRPGPDGIRIRKDTAFRFKLLVPEEATGLHPAIARIVQSLRRVGIEAQPEQVSVAECRARAKSGLFEACIDGVISSPDPLMDRRRWVTGSELSCGYSNAAVDKLYTESMAATGSDRTAKLLQIQDLVYSDQPYLFLWRKPALWAIGKRLHGVKFSGVGPVGFYPGPRAWWVPAERP